MQQNAKHLELSKTMKGNSLGRRKVLPTPLVQQRAPGQRSSNLRSAGALIVNIGCHLLVNLEKSVWVRVFVFFVGEGESVFNDNLKLGKLRSSAVIFLSRKHA